MTKIAKFETEDLDEIKIELRHPHKKDHDMEIVERVDGMLIFRCTKSDCDEEVILGCFDDLYTVSEDNSSTTGDSE